MDRIFGNNNPDNNAMEALLDAMTPENSGEAEDQPRRSTRVRIQPHLYQFDEVERQEKNKHLGCPKGKVVFPRKFFGYAEGFRVTKMPSAYVFPYDPSWTTVIRGFPRTSWFLM